MSNYKDKKHVAYIKTLSCLIGQHGLKNDCSGNTEAHHLMKPYDGVRGMSLKSSDKNLIPLCQNHHMLMHTKHGTEKNLFEHYKLSATLGQEYAKAQFEGHQFYIEQDGDLPF